MRYRVTLDTSACIEQPERPQAYFSNNLEGVELWSGPRLKSYPKSIVRVYCTTETEVANVIVNVDGVVEVVSAEKVI